METFVTIAEVEALNEPAIVRKSIARLRFRTRHLFYLTALVMVSFPFIEEAIHGVKRTAQKWLYIKRAHQAWAAADDSNNDYMDMLRLRHELVSGELQPWMAGFSKKGILKRFQQAVANDIADYDKRGIKGETDANIYGLFQSTKADFERRLAQPLPGNWLEDEKSRQASW